MSSADAEGRSPELEESVSILLAMVDELLAEDDTSRVSGEDKRRLLAAAVRLYAAGREAGAEPVAAGDNVTATDVAVATTDLLEAADIELFELGMWQAWGRL